MTKYCVDCRWCEKEGNTHLCRSPNRSHDPVTGEFENSWCANQRAASELMLNWCGNEGRWFEERQPPLNPFPIGSEV